MLCPQKFEVFQLQYTPPLVLRAVLEYPSSKMQFCNITGLLYDSLRDRFKLQAKTAKEAEMGKKSLFHPSDG